MTHRVMVALIALLACVPGLASWNEILENGWKAPDSYFMYGYSEFVPPYYLGIRAYEARALKNPKELLETEIFREFYDPKQDDTFFVSRYEEDRHVQPGLKYLALHLLKDVKQLSEGEAPGGDKLRGISEPVVKDNPYWSSEMPKQKSLISILPMTMSRTQEEIGRIHPWTVYGGAELDWEELFWTRLLPAAQPQRWFCHLMKNALRKNVDEDCSLKELGVRIFSTKPALVPAGLKDLLVKDVKDVKFLVTFAPYTKWGDALRAAYKAPGFEAIPHPATMVFTGSPFFESLAKQSGPRMEARQIPLAQEFSQYSTELYNKSFYGLKVLDVSRKRHRFQKKAQDLRQIGIGKAVACDDDHIDCPFNLLFNPIPELLGLYGKPIARNVQIWGLSGAFEKKWIFDGTHAKKEQIDAARDAIEAEFQRAKREGKKAPRIHYRNYYPPMDLNGYQVRWYRPLVAWTIPGKVKVEVETDFELTGSFQASFGKENVWLRAEVRDRDIEEELAKIVDKATGDIIPETTASNARKLIQFNRFFGKPLTKDFASALLNPHAKAGTTYDQWRAPFKGEVAAKLDAVVGQEATPSLEKVLTFSKTATEELERDYFNRIVALSEATFLKDFKRDVHWPAKNNTDCAATNAKKRDEHCAGANLKDVARYLRDYYEKMGLKVYSQKFAWKVDYEFMWDGLKDDQENLIVVIPGKGDHKKAVIMMDHYDTAHMGDIFDGTKGKDPGHRHASKGSDDNYSGTVALMQAARVLKGMDLDKDVWLVHVTGEEFPADGLGNRALMQWLAEGKQFVTGKENPQIVGAYVLDMVGHDTDKDRDPSRPIPIFQISPGRGPASAALAWNAHQVAMTWNRGVAKLNKTRTKDWERFTIPKGKSPDQWVQPFFGKFEAVHGEVRPGYDKYSSLFNTDAQQQQDTGVPVVLFMENYDIARGGYHDTDDNEENIDWGYARAVTAIAIESVAQLAM